VRVGIFAILALLGIGVVYYFVTNVMLRRSGYEVYVHFRDVGGLQEGNTVQVAGVNAGLVTKVELLPDQTVDVICTIQPGITIYRQSQFVVTTTITGQGTLSIIPPSQLAFATPLAAGPQPESQQPWGRVPPTLQELMAQIQPRIKDFDRTLTIINERLPQVANRFNAIAGHTDLLVTDTDARLRQLSAQLGGTIVALDSMIQTSGSNINHLTGTMNGIMQENRAKIDRLTTNLASASANLSDTMATLASVAKDPKLKGSLVQTTVNLKDASEKMKKIAEDIESLTGDPQVQANLKGAVYDLSSAVAKANDLLGNFSDATAHGPTPGGSPGPAPSASPGGRPGPRHGLGMRGFSLGSLVQTQVRETWSSTSHTGPQSDLNFEFLPSGRTGLTIGANDLGHNTSYNLLINKRLAPSLQVSGGVLYSNLGLQAKFRPVRTFGIDLRAYDPMQPKLDLYGNLELAKRLELFYGQRNLFGAPNRFGPSVSTPAFGIQANY
jgi:ABC-type transporter Mla subunit MlaD